MKADILEQLVDDYLQARGYFTRHNLKFRPRKDHPDFNPKQDSNHSDIDVLGFNPKLDGPARVLAVSCKSWQNGFRVRSKIAELESNKIVSGREAWRAFRELMEPKWSEAFISTIQDATGSAQFTYVTAVTVLKGEKREWESYPRFQNAMRSNPVQLLTLTDMLTYLIPELGTTIAGSQLGRTLQLLKASGYSLGLSRSGAESDYA